MIIGVQRSLKKITLDDSNCGLDIIRKNILGCLHSFGIENSVANSLAYMIKILLD